MSKVFLSKRYLEVISISVSPIEPSDKPPDTIEPPDPLKGEVDKPDSKPLTPKGEFDASDSKSLAPIEPPNPLKGEFTKPLVPKGEFNSDLIFSKTESKLFNTSSLVNLITLYP